MNFNLLFTTLSTLSFSVKFQVESSARQDFFLFEGTNQSAHLFRDGQSLTLNLQQNDGYKLYKTELISRNFTFSWNEYMVDNQQMLLQDSTGNVKDVVFQDFKFDSPIIELLEFDYSVEPVYKLNNDVNYGYIVLIFLGTGLLFKSTDIGKNIYNRFSENSQNEIINVVEEYVDQYLTTDV